MQARRARGDHRGRKGIRCRGRCAAVLARPGEMARGRWLDEGTTETGGKAASGVREVVAPQRRQGRYRADHVRNDQMTALVKIKRKPPAALRPVKFRHFYQFVNDLVDLIEHYNWLRDCYRNMDR